MSLSKSIYASRERLEHGAERRVTNDLTRFDSCLYYHASTVVMEEEDGGSAEAQEYEGLGIKHQTRQAGQEGGWCFFSISTSISIERLVLNGSMDL